MLFRKSPNMVTPQSLQTPSASCCQALLTGKVFPMHKCSFPHFSLHLSSLALLHRIATQGQPLLQPKERRAWPPYVQTPHHKDFFIPFSEADSLPNAQ